MSARPRSLRTPRDAAPAGPSPRAAPRMDARAVGAARRRGRRAMLAWLLAGAAGIAVAPAAATPARAAPPPELQRVLPAARLHGQGRLTAFGVTVYQARLWVGAGFDAARWHEAALALEVEYALAFDGRSIADRSLREIRRQAALPAARAEAWRDGLERLLPDVRDGDRVTGVHAPGDGLALFHNGAPRGALPDAELSTRFFGIWLAPQTSAPALRAQLLGVGA